MSSIDEVLNTVEQVLLSRQLKPVERFVLRQSWNGQSYSEMARDCAYCSPHLKEIGAQLWHDLSKAVGEKVTKKNLPLVLGDYQQNQTEEHLSATQECQNDSIVERNFNLVAPKSIGFPDSPVPLDSPLYINRPPIEELAYTEISQPGGVICIKAPRKMGKSSLLNRILAYSRNLGYKTVYLDFQEAEEAVFGSLDKFLRWFSANISRQLNLTAKLDDYWNQDLGSKVSCKTYFERYLLESIDSPIVLALNEVNRIFEHPDITRDFLPMLRTWHELAQDNKTWQKLRLAIVHTTEIYLPRHFNQSAFSFGLSIELPQFNLAQVQDLAVRYGLAWMDKTKIQQLMAIVGGHPYLVNLAFYYLRQGEMTLEELLKTAPTSVGIYNHHLRSLLAMLRNEPKLELALQQVVNAKSSVQLEAIAAYKLESMGLVQLSGNQAKPSCLLYRLYFSDTYQLKLDYEI